MQKGRLYSRPFFIKTIPKNKKDTVMDLMKYAVDLDARELHLKAPDSGEPLMTADKRPVVIMLVGADSDTYIKAQRKMLNERMNRNKKPDADVMFQQGIDLLVNCTVGWSGITTDNGKKDLPFTPDAARALYTNKSLPWVKEQVDEFVGNRGNFLLS